MKRLIAYLRENMILDFQGDMSVETLRDLLHEDDSKEARALLSKVVEERGVDDMMIVLADCLMEIVKKSISDDVFIEQLSSYSES